MLTYGIILQKVISFLIFILKKKIKSKNSKILNI